MKEVKIVKVKEVKGEGGEGGEGGECGEGGEGVEGGEGTLWHQTRQYEITEVQFFCASLRGPSAEAAWPRYVVLGVPYSWGCWLPLSCGCAGVCARARPTGTHTSTRRD